MAFLAVIYGMFALFAGLLVHSLVAPLVHKLQHLSSQRVNGAFIA
jgi:hypothetical protein